MENSNIKTFATKLIRQKFSHMIQNGYTYDFRKNTNKPALMRFRDVDGMIMEGWEVESTGFTKEEFEQLWHEEDVSVSYMTSNHPITTNFKTI